VGGRQARHRSAPAGRGQGRVAVSRVWLDRLINISSPDVINHRHISSYIFLVQLRAAYRVHTLTRGETEIGTVAHVTPTP